MKKTQHLGNLGICLSNPCNFHSKSEITTIKHFEALDLKIQDISNGRTHGPRTQKPWESNSSIARNAQNGVRWVPFNLIDGIRFLGLGDF